MSERKVFRSLQLGVLLLLAGGIGAASQQPAPAPTSAVVPPKAVVKEVVFDAGSVTKGDQVKHDFVVENQGKGALDILRVQPSCGCTVTEYDKRIEPGKMGKITATLTTAGFSGPISKTISVSTSDQQMASFQLTIKADVRAILNVAPSENQQFGLVFAGQSQEKEYTITSDDGSPFEISSVQSQDPALGYGITSAPDKKSAVFKVVLPADHPVGPVTGRFTLATTHPKVPTLNLNVFGTVREALAVYPAEVSFPGLSKEWAESHPDDNSLKKTVTITYDDQGPGLELKSATSSLPGVQVTVKDLEPRKRYALELSLKPPFNVGDVSGVVKVATNMKEISIPVRAKVF